MKFVGWVEIERGLWVRPQAVIAVFVDVDRSDLMHRDAIKIALAGGNTLTLETPVAQIESVVEDLS